MRVTGLHNKKLIHVLLDSGRQHNFLDLDVSRKLGCKLEPLTPMSIIGCGGHQLHAPSIKDLTWSLQQTQFSVDVMVLPLGCHDLILGIQWLKSIGLIT